MVITEVVPALNEAALAAQTLAHTRAVIGDAELLVVERGPTGCPSTPGSWHCAKRCCPHCSPPTTCITPATSGSRALARFGIGQHVQGAFDRLWAPAASPMERIAAAETLAQMLK
jgi:hypothetical protein